MERMKEIRDVYTLQYSQILARSNQMEIRFVLNDEMVTVRKTLLNPGSFAVDFHAESRPKLKPYFQAARLWDLLGYLFSPETRRKCYVPAMEDMKADFLKARAKHTGAGARRWLCAIFILRTVGTLLECSRIRLVEASANLIPRALRAAWERLFSMLN
jgi:hypothetical protein